MNQLRSILTPAWKRLQTIVERPPNHAARALLVLAIAIVLLSFASLQVGSTPAIAQASPTPSAVSYKASGSRHRVCGSMRSNATTPASSCMKPPEHQEPHAAIE